MTDIAMIEIGTSSSSFSSQTSLEVREAGIDLSHIVNGLNLEDSLPRLTIKEESADERGTNIQFDHKLCLFCKHSSTDLDENLEHMLKKHGLFIPDSSHLIVDIETLVEYLHLVIFVYFECLYCGSVRSSTQAAQQHMIGKGHCKFDIVSEESEFRDFYAFHSDSEEGTDNKNTKSSITIVEGSMRLPSGKLLSHRMEGKSRMHQNNTIDTEESRSGADQSLDTPHCPDPLLSRHAQSESNKIAKCEAVLNKQLATMRASDRNSLMHLTRPQQRAVLLKGRKQVERAAREANELLLRIQTRANR